LSSSALQDLDEEAEVLKLSMQSLKEYYGLNLGRHAKSAREIGYQLGLELARSLPHPAPEDVNEVVKLLAWYWSTYRIGELFWANQERSLLAIRNCSDCIGQGYGAGYTLCPFKEGLLKAVLEAKLCRQFLVREVECCGTCAPNCVFEIKSTPED
jgi:predicted hydrocarbon binding protein